ncbi:peptide-methionine (S)-S-oxide reductase [Luteimicrobium subarcticum]|uniref:Peptide methionine sulfoxide reductase MsrA n=2 Tax=Luteimicrobium subarcticum TaxID=620910 RepID=A0A2M8WTI8_9MICO|nr:peptide-methionine (S)-S-oxide reductase [Luteimicrobium subarcticum]
MFESLFGTSIKHQMVSPERALRGRDDPEFTVPEKHAVLGTPLQGPWPEGTRVLYLALGCFWGAEKEFWQKPGIVTTAAGYMGGITKNPTYEETCSGLTGHTETVLVAYDPTVVSDVELLRAFWEAHDPTQGFRQGNDRGTQYRSAIYWTTPEQGVAARQTREMYAERLAAKGFGDVTTELRPAEEAGPFWYAEGYHQQYLAKNPNGYCPVHSTGVACPVPA